MKKTVVYRDGIRYWMSRDRLPDGRRVHKFWSSHEWPFYHGWTLESDKKLARKHFMEWIPQCPK